MLQDLKQMTFDFKKSGWSVQKIEKELQFSNGSIGKMLSGKCGVGEFRFNMIRELYEKEIKNVHVLSSIDSEKVEVSETIETPESIENNSIECVGKTEQQVGIDSEPVKEPNEHPIDFAIRKNLWKQKNSR